MIRKSVLLGLTALMALGVFALGGDSARADVGAGSMTAMSIDMDPTGNTDTSVGTIEDCAEVDAGASVTVNLVAQGIPAAYAMIGFGATVGMTDAVLTVTSNDDTGGMISAAPGSLPFSGSESVPGPGPDDVFNISAADIGPIPGSTESGDGTLAVLVIEVNAAAAGGIYNLFLFDGGQVDTNGIAWAANQVNGARIAVGTFTCLSTFKQGDVDCNNLVNSVDALKILRHGAGLTVAQTEPCDDIGTGSPVMGNVDCSVPLPGVNSVDALKILRYSASLSVAQTEPCPDINT